MHTFSKEALERPSHTLQAVGVIREKAGVICRATMDAREDEIVVAVVQRNLSFGGAWTLARENLAKQILLVEDQGGWSFTFVRARKPYGFSQGRNCPRPQAEPFPLQPYARQV